MRQERERVPQPSLVGHYAGAVTRLLAFAIDGAVASITLAVMVAAARAVVELAIGETVEFSDLPEALGGVLVAVWLFLYAYVSWSSAGKTVGMAMLGLRVVRRNGSSLHHRDAFIRVLTFPLSFVFFGLGLAGIVLGREHRALHDVLAGTTVVYDWDARAARLRILAAGPTAAITDPEPDAAGGSAPTTG